MTLTAESLRASLLRASMGPAHFYPQRFFTESLAGSETLGMGWNFSWGEEIRDSLKTGGSFCLYPLQEVLNMR